MSIVLHHMDCLIAMREMKDNEYDLAICDPPYGIGEDGGKNHSRDSLAPAKKYTPKNWDKEPPPREYFEQLIRVSKYQIIFGANHFISRIPQEFQDSSCWIVWNKRNGNNDFADCELAWTSFKTAVRKFDFRWAGMLQENMKNKEVRIHPTQKPVALYVWLLNKYAKEGWKILDTHLGSASSAIAVHELQSLNLSFTGYELDEEYYKNALERLENERQQMRLF